MLMDFSTGIFERLNASDYPIPGIDEKFAVITSSISSSDFDLNFFLYIKI